MIIPRWCGGDSAAAYLSRRRFNQLLHFQLKISSSSSSDSGGPWGRRRRSWGTVPTPTRPPWCRAAPERGSTATSGGWSRPGRPSRTRRTSTSSRSCTSAPSVSRGWDTRAAHWYGASGCVDALSLTRLVCGTVTQYHQVPDEYFTSAVVVSLVLAALFGLVYLLIIPQYVQQTLPLSSSSSLSLSLSLSLSIYPLTSLIDSFHFHRSLTF